MGSEQEMSFSIIISSRNAANLVPCVKAIREAGETARIIVVDDGVDGEVMYGMADPYGNVMERPQLVPMRGEKPFIFARNINIGIRAAGDDDVILLNDDALLEAQHGFTRMALARIRTEAGIIASSCNNVGNKNQWNHRDPLDWVQEPRGSMVRDEPRMVCFVCVYIPRSTINTVGLLDERFVGYGLDDDDYCLRVRNAGLKIGVFDGCYVDHASLKSSFRGEAGAGGDFTGNMRLFIEKWGVDNWGNPRARSKFGNLFPEPRCEEAFHFARCTLKAGHDCDHNFYPGPLPEGTMSIADYASLFVDNK